MLAAKQMTLGFHPTAVSPVAGTAQAGQVQILISRMPTTEGWCAGTKDGYG